MRLLRETLIWFVLAVGMAFAEWDGSIKEASIKDVGGVNYYVINSPEELAWFAEKVAEGDSAINALLERDIILGEDSLTASSINWTPIGSPLPIYEDGGQRPYEGVFDGQGHSIYGMNINTMYAGFFKIVGTQGVVKNLNLMNVNINVTGAWACIGECEDVNIGTIATHNHGLIDNCKTSGIITSKGKVFAQNIGGIVGTNFREGVITNSVNNVNLDMGIEAYIGGVSGYNYGKILNVVNNGYVANRGEFASTSYVFVGGISGGGEGVFEGVVNTGDIVVDVATDKNTGGMRNISAYVGGVSGFSTGSLKRCGNYGNIQVNVHRVNVSSSSTGTPTAIVGGIVGSSYSSVMDAFNLGNIESRAEEKNSVAGGVFGYILADSVSIQNVYVSPYVISAENRVASIVARVSSSVFEVNEAYVNAETLKGLEYAILNNDSANVLINVLDLRFAEISNDDFVKKLNTLNDSVEERNVWELCGTYPGFVGFCEYSKMPTPIDITDTTDAIDSTDSTDTTDAIDFADSTTSVVKVRTKSVGGMVWGGFQQGAYDVLGHYVRAKEVPGAYFIRMNGALQTVIVKKKN